MSNTAIISVPSDEEVDKLYYAVEKYIAELLNSEVTDVPKPTVLNTIPKSDWPKLLPSYQDEHTTIKVAARRSAKFAIYDSWSFSPILGVYYDVTLRQSGHKMTLYCYYTAAKSEDDSPFAAVEWHVKTNNHPSAVMNWKQVFDGYQTVKDWFLVAKLAT